MLWKAELALVMAEAVRADEVEGLIMPACAC